MKTDISALVYILGFFVQVLGVIVCAFLYHKINKYLAFVSYPLYGSGSALVITLMVHDFLGKNQDRT